MESQRKAAFERLYRSHGWGGDSFSGPGSDPEHTVSYVRFVNDWLARHPDCRSIAELGCGDWSTTRLMQLSPRHSYVGYDIVPEAVEANRRRFQSDTVRFECADFLAQSLPGADLLLVKDVLQHLSNEAVHRFVDNVLPRFRHAIITNDVRKYEERRIFGVLVARQDLQVPNSDIADGSSRPLCLDESPFFLPVTDKSAYAVVLRTKPRRLIYVKDILVWDNSCRDSSGQGLA